MTGKAQHSGVPQPSSSAVSASVELPIDELSPRNARHTTRELLETWSVKESEAVHDVLLVVSELVTNAVRHGADRVTLRLVLDAGDLTIAVEDGNAVLPDPQLKAVDPTADHTAEGGRGLSIVRVIASVWGTESLPDGGKRVWATLAID